MRRASNGRYFELAVAMMAIDGAPSRLFAGIATTARPPIYAAS